MKTLAEIKCVALAIAALLALMTLGAMSGTEKRTVITIPIGEIDRASVRVAESNQNGTAEVTFAFAAKSLKEVFRMFATTRVPVVRITDRSSILAEAQLSGFVEFESKGTNRGGVALSFRSAQEAETATQLLRPPPHLRSLKPIGEQRIQPLIHPVRTTFRSLIVTIDSRFFTSE